MNPRDWLASPQVVTDAFLTLIGVIFLWALLAQVIPVLVRRYGARATRGRLRRMALGKSLKDPDRRALEDDLREKGWQARIWTPFLTAWLATYDDVRHKAARPISLLDYCPPEVTLPPSSNRRVAGAIPGVLVALGIFGTFLGLTMGLPNASLQQQHAITQLIAGLRLAFLTSLAGIGASVVFLLLDRYAMNAFEQELRRLASMTTRAYPAVTQEELDQEEARDRAEVTAQMKGLATDIAAALENSMGGVMRDALGEAMRETLVPVVGELQSSVTALREATSTDMVGALRSFSESINENLTAAFKTSFEDLTTNLGQVVTAQEHLRELLDNAAEKMQQQAAAQEKVIDQVIAAAATLETVLSSLGAIADKLKSASSTVGEAAAQLIEASERASLTQKELVDAQRTLSQQVSSDLKALETARNEVIATWQTVTNEARDSIQIVQHAVQQLGSAVGDNLLTALGQFDEKLAEVIQRFSGTLQEAGQTIQELPAVLQAMAKSTEDLSAAATGLDRKLEELVAQLSTSIDTQSTKAIESVAHLAELTKGAADAGNRVAEALRHYEALLATNGGVLPPGHWVEAELRALRGPLNELQTMGQKIVKHIESGGGDGNRGGWRSFGRGR